CCAPLGSRGECFAEHLETAPGERRGALVPVVVLRVLRHDVSVLLGGSGVSDGGKGVRGPEELETFDVEEILADRLFRRAPGRRTWSPCHTPSRLPPELTGRSGRR